MKINMEFGTLASLIIYFVVMLFIGLYAYRRSTSTASAYLLGGRQLSPAVTALSAGASDMSGWMVMGLPGAMYLSGLHNIWIGIGLILGAYLNYLIVATRLRAYTELANDAITLPDFFENRFQDNSRALRIISSLVIILFFTLYTSSGIVGGGKLFESAFNTQYEYGLYVTAGIVVLYTLLGGFLAVSLTDFVQGCIMFVALILVPIVALSEVGGPEAVVLAIEDMSPAHFNFIAGTSLLGIISSLAWGLGYFGQPHIIVRFMAIRKLSDMKTARRIGMSWMIVSLLGAMATGFVGVAYVAKTGVILNDAETIYILLAQVLFHPLVSGFLLAAVLAAIMSTISSQLLVTSSSLTEDIYKAFLNKSASEKELVFIGRVCVLLVALVAVSLAHDRNNSILQLVSNAWAGFGAAFGPMIILSLYWPRMNAPGALAGIVVGTLTVLFWIYTPITISGQSLSQWMYEIVPGAIFSAVAIVLVSLLTKPPSDATLATFKAMEAEVEAV